MEQEIIFKARVDTGSAAQEVGKVDKALKDTGKSAQEYEKRMAEIKAKVESGALSMRELSRVVREYQSIAIAAGRETPIGQEALANAAELTDTLGDLRNETMRLGDDQRALQGAMQLGQGVVAGYGAAQSAMALMGSESKDLEKSLQKLMAVQTLLNSVTQIRIALEKESSAMILLNSVRTKAMTVAQAAYTMAVGTTTGAMKALRIAMMAIPFVAIAAAVMGLVAALDFLSSSTEKAEEAQASLNKTLAETTRRMTEANDKALKESQHRLDMLNATGASEQELHKARMNHLTLEEKARKDAVNLELIEIKKRQIEYKLALNQGNRDLAVEIKNELAQHKDKYRQLRSEDDNYRNAVELEKATHEQTITAEEEKNRADRAARWKAAQEKRKQEEAAEAQLKLDREKMLSDLMIAQIDDENLVRLMKLQQSHTQQRDELRKKFGDDTQLLAELTKAQDVELEAVKEEIRVAEQEKDAEARRLAFETQQTDRRAQIEGELIAMREDFDATQALKAELALIEMETALAQENLTEGEKFLIKEQYAQKLDALADERLAKEKEIQESIKQAAISTTTQALDAAQSLSDAFFAAKLSSAEKGSAKELAIQKKQFEINKKLQIAQAIMQGIQAVQAAYSSGSAIPIVGAVTGPLFAALAAAASIANIVKIKNSKFEGGGSGASAVSAPPAVQPPNINSLAEGNSTLTAGLEGSGTPQPGAPQNIKVNIVDSEIKAGLDNAAKVNTISTIG